MIEVLRIVAIALALVLMLVTMPCAVWVIILMLKKNMKKAAVVGSVPIVVFLLLFVVQGVYELLNGSG